MSNLIIGSYGRGNLGDDLFLSVLLDALKEQKVSFNCAYTDLLAKDIKIDGDRVNTISTTNNDDFLLKIKTILFAKNIIYGGGDLWVVLFGDKHPNKSLLMMLCLNLFARLTFKKVHYIGCGAGKLSGLSLLYARSSARLANTIITRDPDTLKTLKLSGTVMPDITVNLNLPQHNEYQKDGLLHIGISVMYDVPNPEINFDLIISQIADYIKTFDKNDIKITLIPMLVSPYMKKDDLWASKLLAKQLKDYNVTIHLDRNHKSLYKLIAECTKIISVRLHTSILATWIGTPVVGIGYRPKVERFYSQYSLSELCVDINDLNHLGIAVNLLDQDETKKKISAKLKLALSQKNDFKRLLNEKIC